MSFRLTKFLAHSAAALALIAAVQAQGYNEVIDDTPSAEAMTFDLLIVRPLSLAGTIAGVVIFAVALPINLLTFNFAAPARRLIVQPAQFTFTRELGALD